MMAPAGCWITQAAEAEFAERLYFRRRILLGTETSAEWRVATEAEKAEYDARVEAESQIPPPRKIGGND